ncbi:MAG: FAD-dependent oxidoreductase [Bryobacterales bacterium]
MSLQIDTLVIGGGVQGLWILNDLIRRNYRACLITSGPLGSGQTLQSHVFLHRGHLYENRHLVERITEAQPAWRDLIREADIEKPTRKPVWILPSDASQRYLESWRACGLQYNAADLPDIFRGGDFANGPACRAFETEETWLNGEALIKALSARALPAIRTGCVERIDIRNGGVKSVEVTLADGVPVTLRPRFVVLAAGVGNQQLLSSAVSFGNRRQDDRLRAASARLQRLRASQMVVVRGRNLPSLGCIAPSKLFVVSHRDGPDTVWLNSYQIDDVASSPNLNAMPPVDPRRLRMNLDVLLSAVPQLKEMEVRYGVYTGLKSERNVDQRWVPDEEYVEHLGSPSLNLRVVWPSKLTLAPLASQRVIEAVRDRIPRPNGKRSVDRIYLGFHPQSVQAIGELPSVCP